MDCLTVMSVTIWVLGHLLVSSQAINIPHEQCQRDSDCSDASFCDQAYQMCETCIPCQSLFNRAGAKDARHCARSEEDCGICLPGYQSEDLTGQRRSYKCYAVLVDKRFEVPFNTSSMITWNDFTSLSAAIVLLAAILVAFATYYLKSRNGTQPLTERNRTKTCNQDDVLPPPYNDVSSHETYTFALLEPEHLNQATPIGRYHMSRDVELDPEDLEFHQDVQSEAESVVGSTETIPSMWEPSTSIAINLNDISAHQNPGRLVRSQSLTFLTSLDDSPSRSCPSLPGSIRGGMYRHRHVLLSNYRRTAISDGETNVKMEDERRMEFSEPLPPHSFILDESEQPREVSVNRTRVFLRSLSAPEDNVVPQDSMSFSFDPSAPSTVSSRRRGVDEDAQYAMAVSNKRRRKD